MHKSYRTIVILAMLAMADQNASAEECGPLKILASVDLKTAADDTRALVPVTMQGQQKYMLLDTGGAISQITQSTANELSLSTHSVQLAQIDTSGQYSDHAAIVPSFSIGALTGENVEFMITSSGELGENSDIAGIIGPNILQFYDVSLDFGQNKMTLLSQDHCEGKVIYWPASAVAMVPMTINRISGHIVVPVTLDGHKLRALIDTGADNTALNRTSAEGDFNLDIKGPGFVAIGRMSNKNQDIVYRHTFSALSFEGISVANPSIDIIPDLMHGKLDQPPPIGTRFQSSVVEAALPDLTIGMDVLRHLHIYIAYKEQRLYVTLGSAAPVSSSGAGAPPAAAADPSHH